MDYYYLSIKILFKEEIPKAKNMLQNKQIFNTKVYWKLSLWGNIQICQKLLSKSKMSCHLSNVGYICDSRLGPAVKAKCSRKCYSHIASYNVRNYFVRLTAEHNYGSFINGVTQFWDFLAPFLPLHVCVKWQKNTQPLPPPHL